MRPRSVAGVVGHRPATLGASRAVSSWTVLRAASSDSVCSAPESCARNVANRSALRVAGTARLACRPCSPCRHVRRSTASTRAGSGVEVDIRRACRRSRSSGWATTRSASRASGCARRMLNSGFEFPQRRITANLAPALPAQGRARIRPRRSPSAILAASGQVPGGRARRRWAVFGELVAERRGSGRAAGRSPSPRARGPRPSPGSSSPPSAGPRRRWSPGSRSPGSPIAARGRRGAQGRLSASRLRRRAPDPVVARPGASTSPTSAGNSRPRDALEIAAAGGHNLLLVGPPGTGKTMLARRLPAHPAAADRRARRSRSRASTASPGCTHGGGLVARAAVSRPAPHDLAVGPGRRRRPAGTRGGHARAPRRAVPGRARGVPAQRARSAAPAARGRPRDRRARSAGSGLPGAVHARLRHEPVPVRVPRRAATAAACGEPDLARYRRRLTGPLIDRSISSSRAAAERRRDCVTSPARRPSGSARA